MPLYIASDHTGLKIKNHLNAFLAKNCVAFVDVGPFSYKKNDDYPPFAYAVAKKVSENKKNKGILICGSGQGMCVAANKVKGIRASLAWNEKSARLSREHLDVNILCLGADLLPKKTIEAIVSMWLSTKFSEHARHIRRLKKIQQIEKNRARL